MSNPNTYLSNVEIFKDFIERCPAEKLNKGWVLWALDRIKAAGSSGVLIRLDWLEAEYRASGDPEPVICEGDPRTGTVIFCNGPDAFKAINISPEKV